MSNNSLRAGFCRAYDGEAGDDMEDIIDTSKIEDNEVISLKNVDFSYNGTLVLTNINITVEKGDFIAILGPNGSSKSTLLKIMLGLLAPKAGEVKIFGQNVRHFKEWSKIGYISQQAANTNTSFPATVEEIVSSGYYTGFGRLFDKAERKAATSEALAAVKITDLSNRLIGQLSGGQRQKVFLARALVKKPEALFLDEPTTGIDAASQQEFYEMLAKLHKNRMTIVMITHDIDAAIKRATKVCYMEDGNINIYENNGNLSGILASRLIGEGARGRI